MLDLKENWKFLVTVGLVLLVFAFAAKRLRPFFGEAPPAWLRLENCAGKSLPSRTAKQLAQFLKLTKREADQQELGIASLQFVEIQPDGTDAIFWYSEPLENQGATPLANYERQIGTEEKRFLGYYTLEGEPIPFSVRHHPARLNVVFSTIHLKTPVAPGRTVLIFRRESRAVSLKSGAATPAQFNFGRLPQTDTAVHARALCLPEDAKLLEYKPEKGAFVTTDPTPMVCWINTSVASAATPLTASFTLPN